MADSEATPQDKTKEKKKKKTGSSKEKEPRKKSSAESDLQTEAKSPAEAEPQTVQAPTAEGGSDAPTPETPADPAAAPDTTRKSKKSKSSAKPDEAAAPEASADGRKASVAEVAARKASTAEGASTPGAGVSRKASAAAPTAEATPDTAEEQSEEQITKPVSEELPPVEGTYVVPPAATKKDIDLLQDLDENKLMELKEAFELFDYDQDGYIDYKDLKLTYQSLGYPDVPDDDIANMLAEAISPLDFDAFVILLGYKTIEMDPEAVLVEALACWDHDNSGLISEDRIKHDLMTWGDKFSTDEAEQALEDAPMYVSKKGIYMIDYIKFSNTLCGLRKKTKMAGGSGQDNL